MKKQEHNFSLSAQQMYEELVIRLCEVSELGGSAVC